MSSEHLPTDAVLMRMHGSQPAWRAMAQKLAAMPEAQALHATLGRCAWSAVLGIAYAYVELPSRMALSIADIGPLRDVAGAGLVVELSRLTLMREDHRSVSSVTPSAHYTVEMTPEPGWGVELQRWYDTEHLPGLANVPGCLRARRFWNLDKGPRSLACYDLVDASVMGSPKWLAVRQTDWSSRMRPHFTDTRRTMFELAGA